MKNIFEHQNQSIGHTKRGYRKDEIVAKKINMNSTNRPNGPTITRCGSTNCICCDRTVGKIRRCTRRQKYCVRGKRYIYNAVTRKVWNDFKDVRFMQEKEFTDEQKHPVYGDHSRLEMPRWVKAIAYSNGIDYERASQIPEQVQEATYIINLAMLKCHSYPSSTWKRGTKDKPP